MGNYPNTTIYRANKCWCEWVPNSESLLLLDNEMFKCTFIVENVLSFAMSEKCLTRFTKLVLWRIIIINPQYAATCRASLSRETVAVSETILVTLSPYGMCRHWERHYLWFLLTCMRIGGGPSRGREWYSPISIFAIVARFDITNGRVLDAIARAWANAIRGRLLASKYYTKITPEGMRLRLRPMCWFSHWIDNSVSSSNIIDGGSQFIGKQWEHHIKTNGSKISKPMGARPWLLESRTHTMDQLCVYVLCLQLLFTRVEL